MAKIPKADALEYINYFRTDLPAASLKSVWIDHEFIDFIVNNYQSEKLNGVRVYLAKYKKGVGAVTSDMEDKMTIILALTIPRNDSGGKDHEAGYFNYGDPCPPLCNDDEGRKN